MKRTALYISSALLLITGLCTSCQKEPNFPEKDGASVNEVIVKATIVGNGTKVSFTEDETNNKLKTAWESDDHIVGWDKDGNKIELEIANIKDDGTAIFKKVEDSADIPTSGKVYMIYAPGKHFSDITDKTLEYVLSNQGSGKLPALMTATGEVSNNVLTLSFDNQLAIVAVKNPTFPVTEETNITGLKLSGTNILTKATFSLGTDNELQMESSVRGNITRGCDFTTGTDGKTSETMIYFAVLPGASDNVTVSTTVPEGYQISFGTRSFTPGTCYLLDQKGINKQTFKIIVAGGTGGSVSTAPADNAGWGNTVDVITVPSEGYEFSTVTVTGISSGNNIQVTGNTFTMPQEAVTVSGSFEKKNFTITHNGEGTDTYTVTGGTYTIQKGDENVTSAQIGDVITVTPAPNTGYELNSITWTPTDGSATDITSDRKFTMPAKDVTVTVTFKASINGHEYVVIGGKKWATMNIGATTVAGSGEACYGDYYAWGETGTYYQTRHWDGTKKTWVFDAWKIGKGGGYGWQSYCGASSFTNEFSPAPYDNTHKLNPKNDVATVEWGSTWRIPTQADFIALAKDCKEGGYTSGNINPTLIDNVAAATSKGIYYCSNYSDSDGIAGLLFYNGTNKLFFPAAGVGDGTSLRGAGSNGYYWSSTHSSSETFRACDLSFYSGNVSPQDASGRYYGVSVRPVSD